MRPCYSVKVLVVKSGSDMTFPSYNVVTAMLGNKPRRVAELRSERPEITLDRDTLATTTEKRYAMDMVRFNRL